MSKTRKRKWGSPAQKRALARMLAAGRKARRGTTRTRRKSSGRRSARRTSLPPKESPVKKKSRRRSSGRRARRALRSVRRGGRALGGFVPAGTPIMVLGATAGMIVPDFVLSKLPLPDSLKSPGAALAVKGALIFGLGFLAKRFIGKPAAAAFVFGGIAAIAAPIVRGKLGLSGVGTSDVTSQLGAAPGGLRYVQDGEGRIYPVNRAA